MPATPEPYEPRLVWSSSGTDLPTPHPAPIPCEDVSCIIRRDAQDVRSDTVRWCLPRGVDQPTQVRKQLIEQLATALTGRDALPKVFFPAGQAGDRPKVDIDPVGSFVDLVSLSITAPISLVGDGKLLGEADSIERASAATNSS